MPFLTVDYFNQIKDYVHPNLHEIVKDQMNNKLISLPPFHGCAYRNRHGTQKLIDYSRGHRCLTPSWNHFWKKKVKPKYVRNFGKYPPTRYLSNLKHRNLIRNKGNSIYNYKLKKYIDITNTPFYEKTYKDALSQKA